MREDAWLAERLGRPAFTVDEGDDRLGPAPGFYQAKVPAADVARVQALEDAGMRVVDVNVTLRRPAAPAPAAAAGVRDATAEDRPAVLDIAEHDYNVSRFHLDPGVPDEHARALKRAWVDNFFAGTRGDRLLVAERGGSVAGFNLVIEGETARTVDLFAVAEAARRTGAGTALMFELIDTRPLRDVVVGTQVSNTGSLRLYERVGFGVENARFVLHGHVK